MDKNVANLLISYGLTSNESNIYICLLKKPEIAVFEISQKTGIPRATVYITLEKLKKQKLVSSLKKNNIQYFTPENPSRLQTLIKEKDDILSELLPKLNSMIDTERGGTDVKMYTGIDGVKIVLQDILETMKKLDNRILLAASNSEILNRLPSYFPHWLKEREGLNIRTKLILPETERIKHIFESNMLREVRYLSSGFDFKATIEIYGNKIAIFNLKEDEVYSIIIESEPIIQTLKQFFLFAWENAKS